MATAVKVGQAKAATVRRPAAPRLDEGTKGYYKRVESVLEDGGDEEGQLFLKNVTDQVISDGLRLVSCDKDGSRALESLLQHFSMDVDSIKKLLQAVQPDFFKLCVNRCGSHVIQTLLQSASSALSSHTHTCGDRDEELLELFQSLLAVVEEKVMEYVRHPYASHVLGGLLQNLSGIHLDDQVGRSRYSREFRKAKMASVRTGKRPTARIVPDSFIESLAKIARSISKTADLKELLTHHNASPVLQCLLRVLAERLPNKLERLVKRIVKLSGVLENSDEVEDEAKIKPLPDIFTDMVGSHLMETMLQVATPTLTKLIFASCFKGHVMMSALHPVANFPLQQLILVSDSTQLGEVMSEVSSLEEILFAGHSGVVVKLAEAAVTSPDLQPSLLQAVLKAFHVDSHPLSAAPVILALFTYEVFHSQIDKEEGAEITPKPHPTTLHGSLLLQALLKYQDARLLTKSLLKLSLAELVRLSCDTHGSHVITAFITSETIADKKKQRLMKKLEDNLVDLSVDRYGSRVVDILWNHSQLEKKEELAQTLLAHEEQLTADFYGSIVLRNCDIACYRKQQAGWLHQQKTAGKKRQLFQDILSEGQSPAAAPRKRTISEKSDDESTATETRKKKKRKS